MGLCVGLSIVTMIELIWLLFRVFATIFIFHISPKKSMTLKIAEKKVSPHESNAWE
jgi:hypothetical protein